MINLNTNSPLPFSEWRKYNNYSLSPNHLYSQYGLYLEQWSENNTVSVSGDNNYVSSLYKDFLQQLQINNQTDSVNNFLSKLDYNDPLDLDLSLSYFIDSIKDFCFQASEERESIKYTKTKNALKASKLGIELYLKNLIIDVLSDKAFTKEKTFNLGEIANKISINIEDLYTRGKFYLDQGDTIDHLTKTDFEEKLRKESDRLIVALNGKVNNKRKYLTTSNGKIITIYKQFSDYQSFPERFFVNENKTKDNIIFNKQDDLKQKYLSNDVYILSGNGSIGNLNRLLAAENTGGNILQRYSPTSVSNQGELISQYDLPYQLSLTNSGVLNFVSNNLTFVIDVSALKDSIFTIPNPYKYQPGFGLTKTKKQVKPLKYSSDNTYMKHNKGVGEEGTVKDNTHIKLNGYQSKENSLDYTFTGINRKEDNIDFWTGINQTQFKNDDVYSLIPLNTYPVTERTEDLLLGGKTVFSWTTDIYGNDFALIKKAYRDRYGSSDNIVTVTSDSEECTVYDGLFYNDTLSAVVSTVSAFDPSIQDISDLFDTFLTNEITACSPSESWDAPLTGTSCSAISAGESAVISITFADNSCPVNEFYNTIISENNALEFFVNNTVTLSSTFDTNLLSYTVSSTDLYTQTVSTLGDVYIRNVYTSKVNPLTSELLKVFSKHLNTTTYTNITSRIVDFKVVKDTIIIQTDQNEFLTERYYFEDGKFKLLKPSKTLVRK